MKAAFVQPVTVVSVSSKSVVTSLLVKTRAAAAVAVDEPLETVADVMVMVGPVVS